MSRLPHAVAFCLVSIASLPAQTTWIVDASGGPGSHFSDIAPAVAAARPWDRVEVRPGSYGAFTLSKTISVVGAGRATVTVAGRVTVTGVAGGIVELAGMTVYNLEVLAVRVPFVMRDVQAGLGVLSLGTAVITDCRSVFATDCEFLGAAWAPEGMRATDSYVTLVRCRVLGWLDSTTNGGGVGLVATRCHIVVSNGEIRGGDAIMAGLSCAGMPRAPGGDGIREAGGRVVLIDRSIVAGGAASRSAFGYVCSTAGRASVGNVVASPDVTISGLSGRIPAPPALAMPPAANAGGTMVATLGHAPGATYWLFVDLVPAVYVTPLFDVPLLLGPGLQFVASTTATGPGATLPLGVPSAPLLIGRSLFFQAAATSPTTPDLRLSNPAAVLVR